MGRKKGDKLTEKDYETIEKMAAIFCTQEEIASILGIHPVVFEKNKRADEAFRRGRENGKASLKKVQWQKAMEGNIVMLIWLGKQYLGQVDRPNAEVKVEENPKIEVVYPENKNEQENEGEEKIIRVDKVATGG
jgi:hypothetical protein